MKKIDILENLLNNKENELNDIFVRAYFDSIDYKKEMLDFDGVIWEKEIAEIVENCKMFGIKEFTVSSGYTDIAKTLFEFEKKGCKLEGLVEIKIYKRFKKDFEKKVAFKMSL